MVKATFYLPLHDNDGRDLYAEIQAVEDECFVAFGVWTQVGFFKGAWRMESGLSPHFSPLVLLQAPIARHLGPYSLLAPRRTVQVRLRRSSLRAARSDALSALSLRTTVRNAG